MDKENPTPIKSGFLFRKSLYWIHVEHQIIPVIFLLTDETNLRKQAILKVKQSLGKKIFFGSLINGKTNDGFLRHDSDVWDYLLKNYYSEHQIWERLITDLNYQNDDLWKEIMEIYLFNIENDGVFEALRFAIKLLHPTSRTDVHNYFGTHREIFKMIFNRINRGFGISHLSFDITNQENKWSSILRSFGLFAVLPEILPLIKWVLEPWEKLPKRNDTDDGTYINCSYTDDFKKLERVLKLLINNRSFDISFLPAIEKIADTHRKIYNKKTISSNTERVSSLTFATNQAILDETVRLLREADKK